MGNKGTTYERELKQILEKRSWVVGRSAGSHGIDLIAVKPTITLLIEVKSTKHMKLNLSGSEYRQYRDIHSLRKAGYEVIYAIRHVGSNQWFCFIPKNETPGVIDLQGLPHVESVLLLYEALSISEYRGNDGNAAVDESTGGVLCRQPSM